MNEPYETTPRGVFPFGDDRWSPVFPGEGSAASPYNRVGS